ncbi:hypothetical protein BY996DRAFT_6854080 [Phakopsora pachyrhizi]|uniref:Expressed protein n=1 Tax=Phakopsora pachyrhizi TaxID=170000 RepID=A0AAV0BUY1_PHAPC|nr:hypothetical protein BY996DRAFT_6854080 [Phakopsora pachyrhizi]CAH7690046.1 expressed protein [Phakopsora pachyrhizi]
MLINFSFTKAIAFVYFFESRVEGQGGVIDFFAKVSSKSEPKNSASTSGSIVLSKDFDHKNWLSLGGLSFSNEPKSLDFNIDNDSSPLEEHSKPLEIVDFLALSKNEQLQNENLNHSYETNPPLQRSIQYQDSDNENRYWMEDQTQPISSSYSQTKIYESLLSNNEYDVKNLVKPSSPKAVNQMFEMLGNDGGYNGKTQNAKNYRVNHNYDLSNIKTSRTNQISEPYASNWKENMNEANKIVLPPIQKTDKDKPPGKIASLVKNSQFEYSNKKPKKLFDLQDNLKKHATEHQEKSRKGNLYEGDESPPENKILKKTGDIRDGGSATSEKIFEQRALFFCGKSSNSGTKRKIPAHLPQEVKLLKINEPNLILRETKHRKMDLENDTVPHEQIEYALTRLIGQKNQLGLLALFKEYEKNAEFIKENDLKNVALMVINHINNQIKNCSSDSFYIKNKEAIEFLNSNILIKVNSLAPNYNPIWSQYKFKNNDSDLKLKLDSMKLSRIVTELLQKHNDLYKHLADQKLNNKLLARLDLITNSFMGKLFLFYSIIINRVFCNDFDEVDFIKREVEALKFYCWTFENIFEKETDFSLDQIKILKEKWARNGIQVSDTDSIRILKKYHEINKMFKSHVSKRHRLIIWLVVELWLSCSRVDLYNNLKVKQKVFKNFEKFVNFIVYLILNFSPKVFLPKYNV